MKKLNLDSYKVSIKDQQGLNRFLDYEVRTTIINLLTHPQLGLNGPDLMEVAPLIRKIEGAGADVILTNEEYQGILRVLKTFKGFIKNDIQMLERVYNCPDNPDDGSNIVRLSDN